MKKFVVIFPDLHNTHLRKDVGMIPYMMAKQHEYESWIIGYKHGEYPTNQQMPEVHLGFIGDSGNVIQDFGNFIAHNAKKFDVLQLYGLYPGRNGTWINLYKQLNPNGKVYIKLDAGDSIKTMNVPDLYWDILKKCDLISVETKKLCQWLNNHWPVKVEYIPNGILFNQDHQVVDYSEKRNIILTVGRLGTKEKGTEILLEAFSFLNQYEPNWELRLVGPIEPQFKNYINEYYERNPSIRNRIAFTGEITDRVQLEKEYRHAKIFCMPSRWESFGIANVEAGKCGCYIIASNLPALQDITCDEKYGALFPIDDIRALEKLLYVTGKNEKKMREICPEIQEHIKKNFNWKAICNQVAQHLQKQSNAIDVIKENPLNDDKVIIGMPVYNGEKFISEAIRTLLNQTHENFELVICDDQSSDHTAEIIQEFAKNDSRIHYHYNQERLGGARNFSHLFSFCNTEYFMWAAQDDMWHPTYIAKCLEQLKRHPNAAMCLSEMKFIDGQGMDRKIPYVNLDTVGKNIEQSVHEFLSLWGWYALYGLMRSEKLRQTHLYTNHYGGDVTLQFELLFLGEFLKVKEPLFFYRVEDRFKMPEENMYAIDHRVAQQPHRRTYYSDLIRDLFLVAKKSTLNEEQKQRIYQDFIKMMAKPNGPWANWILRENIADFMRMVLKYQDFFPLKEI